MAPQRLRRVHRQMRRGGRQAPGLCVSLALRVSLPSGRRRKTRRCLRNHAPRRSRLPRSKRIPARLSLLPLARRTCPPSRSAHPLCLGPSTATYHGQPPPIYTPTPAFFPIIVILGVSSSPNSVGLGSQVLTVDDMASRVVCFVAVLLCVCAGWPTQAEADFKPLNWERESTASVDPSLDSTTDEGVYASPVDGFAVTDVLPDPVVPEEDPVTDVIPDAVVPEEDPTTEDSSNYEYSLSDETNYPSEETPEEYSSKPADVGEFDVVEDDNVYDSPDAASDDDLLDVSGVSMTGCGTGNPIDDCWRCDPNWASRRQNLAKCAVGFGRGAIGGRNGKIYTVTSPRDDNPANPSPGTLRYAVTRSEPLWIIFASSMTIKLKNELLITSFKTIDGRGVSVKIVGGAGLTLQRVNNVIIHGIAIEDIKVTGPGRVMTSVQHVGKRGKCDGDAISIFTSKNIWIDHCYLSNSADGLIDVIRGSTAISITNNYFTKQDKVMLLGANKEHTMDKIMQVTVAYNTFGPGLVQRMPRIRFGKVHVLNNDYSAGWGQYPIGGSECPTILSQGNVFNAARGPKQVTKRINDGGSSCGGPANWQWKSEGDSFQSGAYFSSVAMKWSSSSYGSTASTSVRPAGRVRAMTRTSGPLRCRRGARC